MSWFLPNLGKSDTSNSRGFLIWSEDPAFGFSAQRWVKSAGCLWTLVSKAGVARRGGNHCSHGVLNFSLGSATVDSTFRSVAYVREATPIRTSRDVRIRGLLLPCICGQGTRHLIHTTQCMLTRVWAKHLITPPKSWRW